MSAGVPSLISPRQDLLWFCGPGIVAAIVGTIWGLYAGADAADSIILWVLAVLLVDVAHVYASLYRTYFDPNARQRHRRLLIIAPIACAWFSFLLYLRSPALFWTVLAYLAVFHFIKQHEGFCMLYARKGGEAPRERMLARIAVWAGTLCPVVYWHVHLPRAFAWFIEGDLLTLVAGQLWLGWLAIAIEAAALVVFIASRVRRTGPSNPFLVAMVLLPALNWNLGIVVFNDDAVFTITNVFFHGLPYLVLVFITGGKTWARERLGTRGAVFGFTALTFYAILALLAVAEEFAWDRLVWGDHPELFGDGTLAPTGPLLAVVVALLTLPQATHYILDRYIWRAGPDNPELATQLGFD